MSFSKQPIWSGFPKASQFKPIVRFSKLVEKAVVGGRGMVVPIDHPNRYLNNDVVITSTVLIVSEDGSFETRNTRYVPTKGE